MDFREFKSTNNADSNQEVEIVSQQKNGGNESEHDEEDGDGNSDDVESGDGEFESGIFENAQSNSNKAMAVPFEPSHGMMEYANYFMQPSNPTGQFLYTSPANSIQPNQFVPMSNVIQLPVQSTAKNTKNKKEPTKKQRAAPYQMMLQNQAQPMVQAQAQSMMLSGQNLQFLVRQPNALAQPNAVAQKAPKHIKASNQRRKN